MSHANSSPTLMMILVVVAQFVCDGNIPYNTLIVSNDLVLNQRVSVTPGGSRKCDLS